VSEEGQEFENFSKNAVFLISRGKKTNFTTYGPPIEKLL